MFKCICSVGFYSLPDCLKQFLHRLVDDRSQTRGQVGGHLMRKSHAYLYKYVLASGMFYATHPHAESTTLPLFSCNPETIFQIAHHAASLASLTDYNR